jgi:hypothetical protein
VKNFSEFWLSRAGLNTISPLSVQLISFTARKINSNNVLTEWTTVSENNVHHYEVEMARGNLDYQQNRFSKLGEVKSLGNAVQEQHYSFNDVENNKSGVRYYRLKIINIDGSYKYSEIRPVVFTEEFTWQVYPNPSSGIFNITYQVNEGESVVVKVYDLNGKTVQQFQHIANGFIQKLKIDLRSAAFSSGLYLLDISSETKTQKIKLVKQ